MKHFSVDRKGNIAHPSGGVRGGDVPRTLYPDRRLFRFKTTETSETFTSQLHWMATYVMFLAAVIGGMVVNSGGMVWVCGALALFAAPEGASAIRNTMQTALHFYRGRDYREDQASFTRAGDDVIVDLLRRIGGVEDDDSPTPWWAGLALDIFVSWHRDTSSDEAAAFAAYLITAAGQPIPEEADLLAELIREYAIFAARFKVDPEVA